MFISQAHAQAGTPPPAGGEWFLPIMMIGLLVFMYFTTIRPQRKRQKEHAELVSSLGKGDEVLMSSGLMGKIVDLTDLYVVVNVSDRVDLKFQRTHVTATLPKVRSRILELKTIIQYPPREPLAILPSPFQLLTRATERWGAGRRIWCKRDDLTGSLLTGNKVRKLEFLAAEACQTGCTVLVTAGALQSNHCRATAAVAAQLGLKCELILRGQEQELSGNYLLSRMLNAEITYVSRGTTGDEMTVHLADAERRWAARGEKALTIPIGGSDAMGIWGYIAAVEELAEDMKRNDLSSAAIVHATGSGGTQAGLNAGVLLHGMNADVISYAVCDDEAYFIAKAQEDWSNLRARRPELPSAAIKTLTNDKYIGPGYGKAGEEIFDTLAELARLEGITLDPVYTGKAFHGLITDLASGAFASSASDIIFMHTGGVFGIFPHASAVEAALGRA